MHRGNLVVLTGIPFLELRDFWSKIVMPLWNLFYEILGSNPSDINDPKSKVGYLMGSFFMIYKDILKQVGTFQEVRNRVQEDKALGSVIKEGGFNMKITKLHEIMSATWSRDLESLWHGMNRSLAHIAKANKKQIIKDCLIMFCMAALPFILLPYSVAQTIVDEKFYSTTTTTMSPPTIMLNKKLI